MSFNWYWVSILLGLFCQLITKILIFILIIEQLLRFTFFTYSLTLNFVDLILLIIHLNRALPIAFKAKISLQLINLYIHISLLNFILIILHYLIMNLISICKVVATLKMMIWNLYLAIRCLMLHYRIHLIDSITLNSIIGTL